MAAGHFVVSLSGGSLPPDCSTVLDAMQGLGISGDVTPNLSLTQEGVREAGCRALLTDCGGVPVVQAFFGAVQRAHPDLLCAHVRSVHNVTEGCVWNVGGVSQCPLARARRSAAAGDECAGGGK
jgi:hypothetical protein